MYFAASRFTRRNSIVFACIMFIESDLQVAMFCYVCVFTVHIHIQKTKLKLKVGFLVYEP